MKVLKLKRFLITILIIFSVTAGESQSFERPRVPEVAKGVSKKPPGRRKQVKIMEPRSVSKAKRKQKAEEKKREKAYIKQLEDDRKHHLDIQTPEVRERIIQNRKNSESNYKARKKAVASRNKKAGKKYR